MANRLQMLKSNQDQVNLLVSKIYKANIALYENSNYVRCVIISNLSGKPLYNLKDHLKKYSTVYEVLQLAPDGSIIKDLENIAMTDIVAFVILCAKSMDAINKDTEAIFSQDKLGWDKLD